MADVLLPLRSCPTGYQAYASRRSTTDEFRQAPNGVHLHKRTNQLSAPPRPPKPPPETVKNGWAQASATPTTANGTATNGGRGCTDKKSEKHPLVSQSSTNGKSNAAHCYASDGQKTLATERRRHFQSGLLRTAKSETNLGRSSEHQSMSSVLSNEDIYQIELMFSSRASKVVVCSCLANLYLARKPKHSKPKKGDWQLVATGVPVLLLNLGQSRSRTHRQLQILLAEKGTGFALWKDVLDNLTQYSEVGKTFHTMFLSDNHQTLAGFSFDSAYSAMQFCAQVQQLTAVPDNVSLSTKKSSDSSKSRRHSFSGTAKKILLKKSEISNPCCFNHVTCLKPHHLSAEFPSNSDSSGPKRAHSCIQIPGDPTVSPSQSV